MWLFSGCDVTSKETVHSCNFEDGSFCGWSNERGSGSLRWVITNASTPAVNTGPLWGHPKGSFYAYTDTTDATFGEEGEWNSLRNASSVTQGQWFRWGEMIPQKFSTLALATDETKPLVKIHLQASAKTVGLDPPAVYIPGFEYAPWLASPRISQ